MSRFEGDFGAAGEARLGRPELLELLSGCSSLAGCPSIAGREREAIACYLSASEGWDEALKALRGAFASDAAAVVRSSGDKVDEREINQRASEYLQWQALKHGRTDNDQASLK